MWRSALEVDVAMEANRGDGWIAAQVPGTVAQALHSAGVYDPDTPRVLHDSDFWYRREITGEGRYLLNCEGLATLAEIYLDGQLLLSSKSMFLPVSLPLVLSGKCVLHIVFRSLNAHLAGLKPARARWRVAMVPEQSLRAVRTTLLGHMPSWCPEIHMVGPWQAVRLVPETSIVGLTLRATVMGEGGHLAVEFSCSADLAAASLMCAGVSVHLQCLPGQRYRAEINMASAQPWWPRGMGEQTLYDVTLTRAGAQLCLGQVGFRHIEVDRGPDGLGFSLVVNGKNLFARGVVYTPPNMLCPGSEDGLETRLQLLADMGVNMLRVAGPFCYESTAFYRTCDRLGILVWQDLMLANFDYPLADEAFAALLEQEVESLLRRIGHSPCLAVLCGGSEVHQQAAMLGLPPERRKLPFYSERLVHLCARLNPHLVVVPNSPSGGELPFSIREGISHYFGVGAYERPLDDARLAAPRFVTECLAFSNVPEPVSLDSLAVPAVHDPRWKAGVPRDRGASWDFEDTRDHYLERIFGLRPAQLRRSDPERYLAASRAVCAHLVSSTLAQWRRPSSPTRGALLFTAGDLRAGAGWGLIDVSGEPKSPYYAFRQMAQPLALFLTDEGCDGLDIHLVNDTARDYRLVIEVRALRQGEVTVASGELAVDVPAYAGITVPATHVLGAFFDLTYAFRFGSLAHDSVVVSAWHGTKVAVSTELNAAYFPGGPYASPKKLGLQAVVIVENSNYWLELSTQVVARFVHIDDRTCRPQDNYFHLSPGLVRRVQLIPRMGCDEVLPQGSVSALNALDRVHYRGAE
jgi:beta-mannosidase